MPNETAMKMIVCAGGAARQHVSSRKIFVPAPLRARTWLPSAVCRPSVWLDVRVYCAVLAPPSARTAGGRSGRSAPRLAHVSRSSSNARKKSVVPVNSPSVAMWSCLIPMTGVRREVREVRVERRYSTKLPFLYRFHSPLRCVLRLRTAVMSPCPTPLTRTATRSATNIFAGRGEGEESRTLCRGPDQTLSAALPLPIWPICEKTADKQIKPRDALRASQEGQQRLPIQASLHTGSGTR